MRWRSLSMMLLFPFLCGEAQQFGPETPSRVDETVSFTSHDASPMDLITAVGRQTCAPIGIVPGLDRKALSMKRAFDLKGVPVVNALDDAGVEAGYRVLQEGDVYVLIAKDATAQQLDLLHHRMEEYPAQEGVLPILGSNLWGWMGTIVDPDTGYGGSILHSLDDEKLHLPVMHDVSVEEIANRIVTLGSKGMWQANIAAEGKLTRSNVGIDFTSYQHYPCADERAK